jgi:hypothetical protein
VDCAAKAADVAALYLSPPENAIALSVDEKPSIQAIKSRLPPLWFALP